MKTNKNNTHNRHGFSNVEMMAGAAILVIIVLSITVVLAQNQSLWNAMYGRINSDVYISGQNARKMFDLIIRKSSKDNLSIDSNGNWIVASYYANDNSIQIDRYTKFSYQGGALAVEHGQFNPSQILSTLTICDNVTNCVFKKSGDSVYMLLTVSDGIQTQTVVSSAKMYN